MNIKPKWKIFSIRQCFSTEFTDSKAEKTFDDLVALDGSDEISKYLEGSDLVPWSPFEYMPDCEFVDHIQAQARYAQDIEGTPDVYVVVRQGCVGYVSSTADINATVVDRDCLDDSDGEQQEMLDVADSLPRYW